MNIEDVRRQAEPVCQREKRFNKVFGIGNNKTGTTSLQAVFYALGLKVAPQEAGEAAGMEAYRGHLEPLIEYVSAFDAFQDAPFSVKSTYAQLDALFPRSKFILTHRDPEVWFQSLESFHRKIFRVPPERPILREDIARFRYVAPGYIEAIWELNWLLQVGSDLSVTRSWELSYDKDHFIRLYCARNEAIVRHFSERPDDLLVIDVTHEHDTRRIVEFLELPASLVCDMPHMNKT